MNKNIRFTSNARKHKIGVAHARFVIENNVAIRMPGQNEFEDEILVIHVMPRGFRRRGENE